MAEKVTTDAGGDVNTYNKTAMQKAIQYLRSRGKYIMDKECKFKPTSSAATDVAQTWANYRREVADTKVRRVK